MLARSNPLICQHFRRIKNQTGRINVVINCYRMQLQRAEVSTYCIWQRYTGLSSLGCFLPWRRRLNFNAAKHFYCTGINAVKSTVKCAATEPEDRLILLTLSDGKSYKFPWLWLRDNCQCAACFNSSSQSRTINWKTFDTKVLPTGISVNEDKLYVGWSDSHKSSFSLAWLLERSFVASKQNEWLTGTYRIPKVSWGSEDFQHIIRKFCYHDIINSDECLLEWLETLAVRGVALLENTPQRLDQIRQLSERVAFIRKTFYGEEFQVIAQPDATNIAYLAAPLQMHIDLPYYAYKPGLILLHCLVQAVGTGGENQLTDGLHVAKKLKADHPDVYRILATTPVEWVDIARDEMRKWFVIHRAPVICEDYMGNFSSVNYSQQQRDSHFSVPLEVVNTWYEAHAVFTQIIHHSDNTVFLKTKPGDILTLDNHRLLHGRAGYESNPGKERHLVGAYLDWDDVYSRIRVLRSAERGRSNS